MGYNSKYTGQQVDNLLDSVDDKADKIPVINHGTNDTYIYILPNEFHKWGVVSSLSISFVDIEYPTGDDQYAEYMFEFVSGDTATTLSLPINVMFETEVVIEPNRTYQVSIVNNIGVIIGV